MAYRICLDAGHGYKRKLATGAAANHLIEDDLAFDFCTRIGHHLRAAGHETVLTRPTDAYVELKPRAKLARAEKCDLFVSIHCNAAGSPNANGAEVLIARQDPLSMGVASRVLSAICQEGMNRRGVKLDNRGAHKSLYVLQNTYSQMRAILIEVGFLTNKEDAAKLADKYWRERVSKSIAKALTDG